MATCIVPNIALSETSIATKIANIKCFIHTELECGNSLSHTNATAATKSATQGSLTLTVVATRRQYAIRGHTHTYARILAPSTRAQTPALKSLVPACCATLGANLYAEVFYVLVEKKWIVKINWRGQ